MRSKYIYLIYEAGFGPYVDYRSARLLSAHTVKHEAHTWLERSQWSSDTANLWRLRDGLSGASGTHSKEVVWIPWDENLLATRMP